MTEMQRDLWYWFKCVVPGCTYERTWRQEEQVPLCPHAAHYIETGHDSINTGLLGDREVSPGVSNAERQTARDFSAGVQYGTVFMGRNIKQKVLAALPDDENLAPGRERDGILAGKD